MSHRATDPALIASYSRSGKLRRPRVPFRVIEADPPTPLGERLLTGLRLAGRWLATPPGTPVRAPRPATTPEPADAPAARDVAADAVFPVRPPCTCYACQLRPAGQPVMVDGMPVDPLAFDADPDAFLRAVFGQDQPHASNER